MRAILCTLGFHRWEKFLLIRDPRIIHTVCKHCGAYQHWR